MRPILVISFRDAWAGEALAAVRARHKEEGVARLELGLRGKQEMVVGTGDLASSMGNIDAEVLSTPRLIGLLEEAAREATSGCLPEGSMTVGTGVNVRHLAATPPGMKVWAEAVLKEIDRRRLVFDVVAHDEVEKVAEGEHERFIVPKERFVDRMKRKMTAQRERS